jgi:hypothetical protein
MRAGGLVTVGSKSSENFKACIDTETAKWSKVIDSPACQPNASAQ